LGHTTLSGYDGDGNLTDVTDRDGRRRHMSYDAEGRQLSQTWYAAGGGVVDTLAFSYDAAGLMLTASNSDGTLTFSYDEEGQIASQTDGNGVSISYPRDDGGRVTQQSDSLGNVVPSVDDAEGNLTRRTLTTTAGAALRVDLGHDQAGLLLSESRYA